MAQLMSSAGVTVDPRLLEKAIMIVLEERNSGGCKLMKLIADLGTMGVLCTSSEELVGIIEAMPGVKILRYSWDMKGAWREKLFIYTEGP